MTRSWTAAAIAVTLVTCFVGLKAQERAEGKWQPDAAKYWNSLSLDENPASSHVFSQWNSQRYAGTAQWSSTDSDYVPPPNVNHQWNPPVIRPDKSSSSQRTKPDIQPGNPAKLPTQTGSQWSNSGTKPADPPTQTGSQWSSSGTKPANLPPSQTGSQWTSSGNQPANSQTSQSGYQRTKPGTQSANQMPQETSHTLNCNVQTEVRVPCGASHISAAECEAINCCFDGQSCYFGRAVTVQCTKDGQFIVVVSKDSTSPRLDLTSFSLLGTGPGCTYADSNYQFAIYQFPVTQCGSQVMEDSDAIIYENRLFSSFEVGVGPYGSITRDSHFELLFQCKYTTSAVLPVVVEVVRVDNPIRPVAAVGPNNVQLRLANGQCQTKGCNAEAAAYTSYYTEYPVTKVLRDPVYVEVQLMDKTDPLLVLRLGRCWVTTSPNPHTLPQWDILIDGCPYKDDRYLSALIPIEPSAGLDPSHYRRFVFKMFTFVDTSTLSPLSQQIYIHCSTDMCGAKPGHNCEPSCYRRRRDVDALVPENAEPKAVGTVGPILISKPDQ